MIRREKIERTFEANEVMLTLQLRDFLIFILYFLPIRCIDEISIPRIYDLRSKGMLKAATLRASMGHRQSSRLHAEKPHQTLIKGNIASRLLRDVLRGKRFPLQVSRSSLMTTYFPITNHGAKEERKKGKGFFFALECAP